MDRRDALKSLAALASATGMTVTPVSTQEAGSAALVVLKTDGPLSMDAAEHIKEYWRNAVKDTALQDVRCVVMNGLSLEVIRK